MKKLYEQLECSVCHRRIERLIDPTRASIDKCNITFKCTGILSKRGETNTRPRISDTTQVGVRDWIPRSEAGKQPTGTEEPVFPPIMSGDASLTIALHESIVLDDFVLPLLELPLTAVGYVEYYFNRSSGTTLISGTDDSARSIALRFTASDVVKVFNNGVQLPVNTFNHNTPNTVKFNPPLSEETNSIRVVVYKEESVAPIKKQITFKKINSTHYTGINEPDSAWGNISSTGIFDTSAVSEIFNIYVCDNLGGILGDGMRVNYKFKINPDVSDSGEDEFVDLSLNQPHVWYFLLGTSPFGSCDTVLTHKIDISELMDDSIVIDYKLDSFNNPIVTIPEYYIKSTFPLMIINDVKLEVGGEFDTDSTTEITDPLKSEFIN